MSADHGAAVNEWVNVVRRARLGSTAHSVAVTLASYANPDGTKVYPGVARLAIQCEISYAAVRRALAKLRRAGLVELVRRGARRSGRSDEYRLILGENLLDLLDVPDPDQERKAIEDLKERERHYRSPLSGNTSSTAHRDPVLPLSPERPPSISTHPERDPPSTDGGDLRTDLKVGGAAEPVDNPASDVDVDGGQAPLAALASTDEKDVCPDCGVWLDPGRVCGNRQCNRYRKAPP